MRLVKAMFIRWQTASGPPVTVGAVTVTPQAQALMVRLPFGGFVWNRPAAVVVERAGRVERIPIRDVTRILHLGLLGLGLVFASIGLIAGTRRKEPVS